jgi:NAD(P) transhydrogenase subunit alpha
VMVETGAGDGASIPDKAFADAGAEIAPDAASTYADADVVLKVRHPMTAAEGTDELALMKRGAVLIGILNPHSNRDHLPAYAEAGVTALAMELVPRITRAQSMDVLSSQANLAGYRAVLDAASELPLIGCPSAAPCSSPI